MKKKNIYNSRLQNIKEIPIYDIEKFTVYKIGLNKHKKDDKNKRM